MMRLVVLSLCLLSSWCLDTQTSFAQPITLPPHAWVTLSGSSLQSQPIAVSWLRRQENGQLFQSMAPVLPTLGAIVVPVFDESHAHYGTQVKPFAGRNPDVAADEAAINRLLTDARMRHIPVYLSIDALAWQKGALVTGPPLRGVFAAHPNWREIRQQGVEPQAPDAFYASPWNHEVRDSLKALVEEVGHKFPDAAGVVLNLRLSDREILGFSDAARLASIRDLGLDPFDLNLQNRADEENNKDVQTWRTWKRDQLSEFGGELREAYLRGRPGGRVLAWGVADYYERQEFSDLRSAQDWRGWLNSHIVDGVLLEGRWTPRYPDAGTLAALQTALGFEKGLVLPVLQGAALTPDSNFARDWSALQGRANAFDTPVFALHSDADLQQVVRLLSGQTKLELPPTPQVGEPFPDFTLNLPDGKPWEPREVRGHTALALLLNPDATPKMVLPVAPPKVQMVAVSSPPAVPVSPFSCVDSRHELLGRYPSQTRLLLLDSAGFLRRDVVIERDTNLQSLLQSAQEQTLAPQIGRPAPDFSLLDMHDQVRHLSDVHGKNLLLTFFPKCFTGGCSNHLTSLRNKTNEFKAANTEIWAVSIDAPDVQIAFAQSLGLPFPLLPDVGRNLCLLYGATQNTDQLATRMSVLIDKQGIVRWIDTDVHVSTHGADVLVKIKELGLDR